ncbi:MAG: hypothetical protein JWQ71_1420 [Pedosphaera sp.]|nr:hypothetical protein [Pedosphaera sp.]
MFNLADSAPQSQSFLANPRSAVIPDRSNVKPARFLSLEDFKQPDQRLLQLFRFGQHARNKAEFFEAQL